VAAVPAKHLRRYGASGDLAHAACLLKLSRQPKLTNVGESLTSTEAATEVEVPEIPDPMQVEEQQHEENDEQQEEEMQLQELFRFRPVRFAFRKITLQQTTGTK
jgi:hypothetical protein